MFLAEKGRERWNHTYTHTRMQKCISTHPECAAVIFKSRPAGRRNDAFPAMKAETLYREEQLDYAIITRILRAVFVRTDVDTLLRGSIVRNPSFSFAWLYLRERDMDHPFASVRSYHRFVLSSSIFAGEDVETSRTFSAETLCRPASSLLKDNPRSFIRPKICHAVVQKLYGSFDQLIDRII